MIVDSGIGKASGSQDAPVTTAGRFAEALEQAGIVPADVEVVLVSHVHPDHVGGLFDEADQPLFPNASYFVSREEVVFWQDAATDLSGTLMPPPMRDGVIATARRFLARAEGRIRLFDAGDAPVDGVQSVPLPGHTPGQVGFLFEGGDEQLFYTADAVGHPLVSMRRPEWRFAFDADASVAVATRKSLAARLVETGWYSFTPHFPWPSYGRVARSGDEVVWTPGKR